MSRGTQTSFRPRRTAYAWRALFFGGIGLAVWFVYRDATGIRMLLVGLDVPITTIVLWQALDPRPSVLFDDDSVKIFGGFRVTPGRSHTYSWSEISEISELSTVRSGVVEGFEESGHPLVPASWSRFFRRGSGTEFSVRGADGRQFRLLSAGDDEGLRDVWAKMKHLRRINDRFGP